MKKLLVVLLSLGLIAAFCATASAADVKFGGSYYVVGIYQDDPTVEKKDTVGQNAFSHAFFYQRIRLQPVFAIAEGLTFTARMDAMEKVWGNTNQRGLINGAPDDQVSSRRFTNANQKIQESLEFERGYVTFLTKIGVFQVGYQNVDDWGTDYSDFSNSRPRFAFVTQAGPVEIAFTYEKVFEADQSNVIVTNAADADSDTYALSGTYKGKGLEAGLLYKYYVYNVGKPGGSAAAFSQISPYAKATIGPVYLEGEAQYWFGKSNKYEAPAPAGTPDVDLKAWGAYLKARFNFGPAYAGALFSYASGNDFSDDTKNTTKPGGAGTNFAPAFLLMNDALATWTGGQSAGAAAGSRFNTGNTPTSWKFNSIIYNAFVGVNPTPKLNVEAGLTYATVDQKAMTKVAGVVTDAVSNKLGTELDIKATYKIYDNLSYMIGAGYLWTGDYFKGASAANQIENDYILLNQLTLSF